MRLQVGSESLSDGEPLDDVPTTRGPWPLVSARLADAIPGMQRIVADGERIDDVPTTPRPQPLVGARLVVGRTLGTLVLVGVHRTIILAVSWAVPTVSHQAS
jgi:hypothetical protein